MRIWAAALFFFFFPEESEIVICGMGLRLRPRCDSVFTSFADKQAGILILGCFVKT